MSNIAVKNVSSYAFVNCKLAFISMLAIAMSLFTTHQTHAQATDSTEKSIKQPVFIDPMPVISIDVADTLVEIVTIDTLEIIGKIDSADTNDIVEVIQTDTTVSIIAEKQDETKSKPIVISKPDERASSSASRELLFVVNVIDSITHKPLRAKVYLTNLNNEGTRYDGTGICDQEGKFYLNMTSKSHFLISLMLEDYLMITEEIDLSKVSVEDKAYAKTFELRQIRKGDLIDIKNIHFAPGKYYLEKESHPSLNRLVEMMRDNPKLVIRINGHTDNTGNEVGNLKLSQERVFAVRYYLIQKGISASRVKSKAFGGSKPIASNREEETRKLNRRVEFEVIKH